MTVEGRPAKPDDPEASLRENLAAQVSAAQSELSANLIELRSQGGDAALIGQADVQLGALLALRSQIDRAGSGALATIGARVAACVATATTLAQQAQAASFGNATRAATELASASEAARAKVTSFVTDFYERKIFDPYLEFSSEADKEAYRERKAARRKAIEEAQALNTPQGDLQALRLAQEQLHDAGVHGADRSPQYRPMVDNLDRNAERLEAAIAAKPTRAEATAKAPTPDDATPDMIAQTRDAVAGLLACGVDTKPNSAGGHGLGGASTPTRAPDGRC